MWLADDGKPPIHLAHLTPQLASQVTQVWAVHIDSFRATQQVIQMLPPAEEPDSDPPLHPEKRPRLEQTQLHYANVTTFGRQVIPKQPKVPKARFDQRGGFKKHTNPFQVLGLACFLCLFRKCAPPLSTTQTCKHSCFAKVICDTVGGCWRGWSLAPRHL